MITTHPLARFVRGTVADLTPDGLPLLRGAVRRAVASTLQGPRPGSGQDPERYAGDPGLTGPGSASWRVMSDVAGLPAGVRALLLQALHPLAVAGVSDHSGYRDDQFGRLHRTGAWVAAGTFGAVPEAVTVSRMVRRQHARVRGTAPDGRPYAADDPRLLTWVSITFTDSLLAMNQAFSAHAVDAAVADRFVLEQARVGALLDPRVDLDALDTPAGHERLRRWDVDLPLLDDGLLPTDVASLESTLRGFRSELGVGAQGEEILEFLADPGIAGPAMPAYRLMTAAAVTTMPVWLRDLLPVGLPSIADPAVGIAHDALLGLLRMGLGSSPARTAAEARVLARPGRDTSTAA